MGCDPSILTSKETIEGTVLAVGRSPLLLILWYGAYPKRQSKGVNRRGVAQLAARAHGVREVAGSNPVTPTNLNIANFAGSLLARSPRLRRGFARIFPYISAQNQTDGQNQKSVFCPVGGGSFQFFPQTI